MMRRPARPARHRTACRRTTGSTSRSPTSRSGRLQIFNNWSPAMVAGTRRSGWASSTSATRATNSGRCRTPSFADFAARELERSASSTGATSSTRRSSACRKPILRTSAPTRTSTACADYFDGFQPVPGRPQRDAPLQQPGPLDADGQEGRRGHRCRLASTRPRYGPSTSTTTTTRKSGNAANGRVCDNCLR